MLARKLNLTLRKTVCCEYLISQLEIGQKLNNSEYIKKKNKITTTFDDIFAFQNSACSF